MMFIGVHSTLIINMQHIKYATSEGYSGADVLVKFIDGEVQILTGENAKMFKAFVLNSELCKIKP